MDDASAVTWEGTLLDGGSPSEVVLETTDEHLAFRTGSGRSGVLAREHVTAVESQVLNRVEYDLEDHRLIVGGGIVVSLLTFAGAIVASSGLVTLFLLGLTSGGLWATEYGWRNRDRFDGFDRTVYEMESVVVHTDAGNRREFRFPAENRAGERLRDFVCQR